VEILALRHQIGVLQRSARKRQKLTAADRLFWAWLSGVWRDWRPAVVIVKPETVIGWHRQGFRLFWTWKIQHGRIGRPVVSQEVRDLIRKMSRENPTWGAPRIHGELLKLGIEISETSVSKYMVRPRKPPSQNWRHIPAEPRQRSGVGRLLHGSDDPLSGPVCVLGAGP
jgi:putative transposase